MRTKKKIVRRIVPSPQRLICRRARFLISVCLGSPADRKQQCRNQAATEEHEETSIPSIVFHQGPDSNTRYDSTQIAKETRQPDGRGGSTLRRQVRRSGANQTLRAIHKKTRHAEQGSAR